MRKATILTILLTGLCFFSACGKETTADSAAMSDTTTETSQTGKKLTLPESSMKVPEQKITAVSFTYSSDEPLQLDIDEKSGSLAAHAESEGFVTESKIQIYAEDETLVEISDITVKDGGLVNFYLTGKKAGTSKLYIATADGSLVSEPLEFKVRSEEERAYDEQTVYYCTLGEYWHYSEECAGTDGPGTFYNYQGGTLPAGSVELPVFRTTRENLLGVGDRTPCPECAADEISQQDGE